MTDANTAVLVLTNVSPTTVDTVPKSNVPRAPAEDIDMVPTNHNREQVAKPMAKNGTANHSIHQSNATTHHTRKLEEEIGRLKQENQQSKTTINDMQQRQTTLQHFIDRLVNAQKSGHTTTHVGRVSLTTSSASQRATLHKM